MCCPRHKHPGMSVMALNRVFPFVVLLFVMNINHHPKSGISYAQHSLKTDAILIIF